MKTRKILLTGILGAVLIFGCTACGNKEEEQQTPENVEQEAPEEYPEIRDLGEMLAEAEGVDYEEIVANQSGYKKGKLSDTDYTSRYVGIHFTLPEGYAMNADIMDLINELADSAVLGDMGIEGNFKFRCEMMAVNVEGKNAAVSIMSAEMDTANADDNGKGMEELMTAEGYDIVSMWGQDWYHLSVDRIKNSESEMGEMYCKVYPDAFYTVVVIYGEKDVKEKKVLLSAFEETVKEGTEPADTKE